MGIEVLLRTPDPLADTVGVLKTRADAAGLVGVSELHHHDGSVRLAFDLPAGRRLIITLQQDGEIHAESFGAPRGSGESDLVVIESLLPGATTVGTNPSWDSEEL